MLRYFLSDGSGELEQTRSRKLDRLTRFQWKMLVHPHFLVAGNTADKLWTRPIVPRIDANWALLVGCNDSKGRSLIGQYVWSTGLRPPQSAKPPPPINRRWLTPFLLLSSDPSPSAIFDRNLIISWMFLYYLNPAEAAKKRAPIWLQIAMFSVPKYLPRSVKSALPPNSVNRG